MSKKTMHNVQAKKNSNYVGKINMNKLMISRSGKVNPGSDPGLRSKVDKSKKHYDRNREKEKLRSQYRDY